MGEIFCMHYLDENSNNWPKTMISTRNRRKARMVVVEGEDLFQSLLKGLEKNMIICLLLTVSFLIGLQRCLLSVWNIHENTVYCQPSSSSVNQMWFLFSIFSISENSSVSAVTEAKNLLPKHTSNAICSHLSCSYTIVFAWTTTLAPSMGFLLFIHLLCLLFILHTAARVSYATL